MSLRPIRSTYQVPGQSGLHCETLSRIHKLFLFLRSETSPSRKEAPTAAKAWITLIPSRNFLEFSFFSNLFRSVFFFYWMRLKTLSRVS